MRASSAASRARIVAAADAERRRLERDLHDGAQQRLVTMAIALRDVELDRDVDSARAVLASAREELALALNELRGLAHDIHPAILTDHGLPPALQALAARTPLLVEVAAVPEKRLPEAVEAAAYFVVAEALTNVVKHPPTTGTVAVTSADGRGAR